MLKPRENPIELVTKLEDIRAKIAEMAPTQVLTEESLKARILDTIGVGPEYEQKTRRLGGEGSLPRD